MFTNNPNIFDSSLKRTVETAAQTVESRSLFPSIPLFVGPLLSVKTVDCELNSEDMFTHDIIY